MMTATAASSRLAALAAGGRSTRATVPAAAWPVPGRRRRSSPRSWRSRRSTPGRGGSGRRRRRWSARPSRSSRRALRSCPRSAPRADPARRGRARSWSACHRPDLAAAAGGARTGDAARGGGRGLRRGRGRGRGRPSVARGGQDGPRAVGDERAVRAEADEPEPELAVARQRPTRRGAGSRPPCRAASAAVDDRLRARRGSPGRRSGPGTPRLCDRSAGPTNRTSTPSMRGDLRRRASTALGDSIWMMPRIRAVDRPGRPRGRARPRPAPRVDRASPRVPSGG